MERYRMHACCLAVYPMYKGWPNSSHDQTGRPAEHRPQQFERYLSEFSNFDSSLSILNIPICREDGNFARNPMRLPNWTPPCRFSFARDLTSCDHGITRLPACLEVIPASPTCIAPFPYCGSDKLIVSRKRGEPGSLAFLKRIPDSIDAG